MALPRQSQAYLCGVGKALRLACSMLAPCLFVGVALGREHIRSGYKLRRAALRFGLMVFSVPLRSNTEHHQTFTTHPPSSASALSSVPPRSVDRKSGIWHCYAEPSVFVRCGQSPPPCLLHAAKHHLTCLKKVGRVRLSGLAAPLPLLPSLNSVSLSEGACRSPQFGKTDNRYPLSPCYFCGTICPLHGQ